MGRRHRDSTRGVQGGPPRPDPHFPSQPLPAVSLHAGLSIPVRFQLVGASSRRSEARREGWCQGRAGVPSTSRWWNLLPRWRALVPVRPPPGSCRLTPLAPRASKEAPQWALHPGHLVSGPSLNPAATPLECGHKPPVGSLSHTHWPCSKAHEQRCDFNQAYSHPKHR